MNSRTLFGAIAGTLVVLLVASGLALGQSPVQTGSQTLDLTPAIELLEIITSIPEMEAEESAKAAGQILAELETALIAYGADALALGDAVNGVSEALLRFADDETPSAELDQAIARFETGVQALLEAAAIEVSVEEFVSLLSIPTDIGAAILAGEAPPSEQLLDMALTLAAQVDDLEDILGLDDDDKDEDADDEDDDTDEDDDEQDDDEDEDDNDEHEDEDGEEDED